MESLEEILKTYIRNLSVFYCKKIENDSDLDDAINKLEDCIKNKIK